MIIPVSIGNFELPEFPDKNFRMYKSHEERCNDFYRKYPHGHIDFLPSYMHCYEYCDLGKNSKLVYQIVRTGKDSSILEGNYSEELAFYYCWKEKTILPYFEGWKLRWSEWVIGSELPIEMVEELLGIPFREQCRQKNELRKRQYEEYRKHQEAIYKSGIFFNVRGEII